MPLRQCEPGQYFNSRTRVGCDQFSFDKPTTFEIFQLTHPRGVRPRAANLSLAKYIISTHAPAWGATMILNGTPVSRNISTHAPPRGATYVLFVAFNHAHFNSRTPEGCDSKNRQKSLDTFVCLCATCRIKSTYNSDLSMLTTIILSF